MGFETPESGAIYFDDQDQAHLDVQALRQQVGVVLQSGRLLTDSLYRNIVGNARLTMEDAWAAAAISQSRLVFGRRPAAGKVLMFRRQS